MCIRDRYKGMECNGHEGEGYESYVMQLVEDFKKAYGGYISLIGYLNSDEELLYEVIRPYYQFSENCRKSLSMEKLREVVGMLKGEEELKREEKNLRKLHINEQIVEGIFIPTLQSTVTRIRNSEYKKRSFTVMCRCEYDFDIHSMFHNCSLAETGKLQLNPHFNLHSKSKSSCEHTIFKNNSTEEEKRKDIGRLWKVYVQIGGECCIVCKKSKEHFAKHCDNEEVHNNEKANEVVVCKAVSYTHLTLPTICSV
eukprot:TRINITY_DN8060_c0_g2_i2.p1 TRINITY_DN8060_c0_g2~~TRINITY_DN8060_c0_g2_i2.p1  ORF type:complete len:254 (-),score=40.35 TRINITY_DN8060_c0_g2_i2:51-812(-)